MIYERVPRRGPDLSDLEFLLREKIEEIFLPSFPSILDHTLDVVERVHEALPDTDLDPRILVPLAYLHDIGHALERGGQKVADVTDPELRTVFHSEIGSEAARTILREMAVPYEEAEEIAHLISIHHQGGLSHPAVRVFQKADRGAASGEGSSLLAGAPGGSFFP